MNKKTNSLGFSLVELMVAISILMLISSVVVVSKKKFGESTLVASSAADLATGIRQAQVFGTSAKKSSQSGTTNFTTGYGIHLSKSSPNQFVLFSDNNDNGIYEGPENANTCGSNNECVSITKINQGNRIQSFCADLRCTTSGSISSMDILFKRPNLEPYVKSYMTASNMLEGQWSCASFNTTQHPLVNGILSYNFPTMFIQYIDDTLYTKWSNCTACPPATGTCYTLQAAPGFGGAGNITSNTSGSVVISSSDSSVSSNVIISSVGQVSTQ